MKMVLPNNTIDVSVIFPVIEQPVDSTDRINRFTPVDSTDRINRLTPVDSTDRINRLTPVDSTDRINRLTPVGVQEPLGITWNEFIEERLNVRLIVKMYYPNLQHFELNKIMLDGILFSDCCDNFGKPTCCKANKKLKELGFRSESIMIYYFVVI